MLIPVGEMKQSTRHRFAQVVLNLPLREAFTYAIPEELNPIPPIGSRVFVPFGPKTKQVGFVVGYQDSTDMKPDKIKEIESCLDDTPIIDEASLSLLKWVADYYYCSLGEVAFTAFPFGARTGVRKERVVGRGELFDNADQLPRFKEKRKAAWEAVGAVAHLMDIPELCRVANVSPAVVDGLVKAGVLAYSERSISYKVSDAEILYQSPRPVLNREQVEALIPIEESLKQGIYRNFLLHGVTGSGKTEIFLHAIENALALGRSALVLVPEIALTPQTAARYRGRFPGQVEVLHSGLSQPRRFEAWMRVRAGEIPIVVGTRSAVFAPLHNLGLIIVDEEHDPSYKQADPAPRYHGRDVAAYRASLEGAVAVFGSATPALESYENVARKKYHLLSLPNRATAHQLPVTKLVDMRHRPPGERVLSDPAIKALGETFDMGLQAILFLNRRGHSTQIECRSCGAAVECPNCSVTLVWHARDKSLRCHHCGHKQPEPEVCPGCNSVFIRARGYGTEQVLETFESWFPGVRAERLDLDVTQETGAHDRILSQLRKGEIQALVGTQMVSKGLDMPGVRLVVVVQAETALNMADFRAAERSFALLTQVAGRAGRGDHAGLVLIQSYSPGHYSIHTALDQDYLGFRKIENRLRRNLSLPPHTRLLNIRYEGEDAERTAEQIKALAEKMKPLVEERKSNGCRLIGPAPCPIERVQNRWRWQLQIASRNGADRAEILHHPTISEVLQKPPTKIRILVDIDPMNLL